MKRLKKILIIDGYNVINSWKELKVISSENLQFSREKLNYMISEYSQFKGYETIIVYDAYRIKNSTSRTQKIKNLEIVFTKENETADTYIERYITQLGPKKFLDITVATDDIAEQQVVIGKGGNRISTQQLYIDVLNSNIKINEQISKTKLSKKITLNDFLGEDVMKLLDEIRKKDI